MFPIGKDKVRAAWISFVGRILAQFVGAAATIALGLLLGQIDGLRVISRTSTTRYKGERKTLPEIASELGVDMMVEGSVAQAEGRVRITARLINGKTDERVWGQTCDRPARDILALQGEVAAAIAQAYAGLADTYSVIGLGSYVAETVPTRQVMDRAKALAERALALDNGLAEAHASLGWIRYRYEWDWAAAERSFRQALSLNPGSAIAHRWYALYLEDADCTPQVTRWIGHPASRHETGSES